MTVKRYVTPENRSTGLMAAIKAAGGVQDLAAIVGRTTATVSRYKRVPPKFLDRIAEATGLDREILNDRTPAAPPETPTPGENANG